MHEVTMYALHDELEKIGGLFSRTGKLMAEKGAPALKRAAGKVVKAPGKAVNWMKAPVNPGVGKRTYSVV